MFNDILAMNKKNTTVFINYKDILKVISPMNSSY